MGDFFAPLRHKTDQNAQLAFRPAVDVERRCLYQREVLTITTFPNRSRQRLPVIPTVPMIPIAAIDNRPINGPVYAFKEVGFGLRIFSFLQNFLIPVDDDVLIF